MILFPFYSLFFSLIAPSGSFTGRPVCLPQEASSTQLSMISHRKGFKKLGKPADQRKALLRALTTETIRHGRIKTTLVRARAGCESARPGRADAQEEEVHVGQTPRRRARLAQKVAKGAQGARRARRALEPRGEGTPVARWRRHAVEPSRVRAAPRGHRRSAPPAAPPPARGAWREDGNADPAVVEHPDAKGPSAGHGGDARAAARGRVPARHLHL